MFTKWAHKTADQLFNGEKKAEEPEAAPAMTKSLTHSGTPSQFLRKLRTSSILARTTPTESSSATLDSMDSDSSSIAHSDTIQCNNANMPNKVTGELGVQIYPCPEGREEIILQYVPDRHFQYIHPHVFAPACLTNVRRMGGGGSGVAVFSGTHPDLGEIVMKHGGYSDLKELFALATISAELKRRGNHGADDDDAGLSASRYMKECLPEFKMVYISPQQLLFKQKAVWGKLKKVIRVGSQRNSRGSFSVLVQQNEASERRMRASISSSISSSGSSRMSVATPLKALDVNDSQFLCPGASIRIYECDTGKKAAAYLEPCSRNNKKGSLTFVVPKTYVRSVNPTTLALHWSENFNSLEHLQDNLMPVMTKHLFKFTLAQKRIGGTNAKTGSQWLYEGKLEGIVLGNLISKFIKTIRNLQALTLPEEVDVVDQVREEVNRLRDSDVRSDGLSTMADQFMGNSIKKNFHPQKGRIRFLQKTCFEFRDHKLVLLPEEELPAKHLATLAEPDAFMSDVFVGCSTEPPLFHPDKDLWINLMMQATSDRKCMSPNALKRVWTSGLCDAGIHNLFVSRDDLCFFDLGVPQLQSLPGFMTKFLFSFFHILGMQEDEENDNEWFRRFVPEGDKLALTEETKKLLPKAYDAFEVSLNRIIDEVFDGDNSLRWLLLQYVTLQLLSDASFCLQRWSLKGGGCPREDNHNQGLERWLWRALWDIHVAFDINTCGSWCRLNIEHPESVEINRKVRESMRISLTKSCCNLSFNLDQIEEENCEENRHESWHSSSRSSPKVNGKSASSVTRKRHSLLRWPSERLSGGTLRELTSAAFEFNHANAPDLASDDESISDSEDDNASSSIDDSAILPSSCRLSSLESLDEGDEQDLM